MQKERAGSYQPWLCVLAGRSGMGKTMLAKQLAQATGACYLRVDAVETALCRVQEHVGTAGYVVVHEVAASNLLLGLNVIVDAVNAVPEARAAWHKTAHRCGAQLTLLETVLPDGDEHRRRVESREADIPGHQVPTWNEVQADGWVPWSEDRDGAHIVVDTTDGESAMRDARGALPAP
ncbi:AAA family ATPase [Kocuria tytonis]|uniref:AAA family ATPase n=1 Tax=Kocuria tytonis TaxID=2054280 RepID=A0A495ABW9_9MICC|nr:AAA family ATPase [Kocuria tytonis]RKQ37024.1 AAA family ATPase [Kocuria tytonis]